MQFKTLFLIFSAVSLIACSSTSKSPSQQDKYAEVEQKGFSLSFPDQEKWAVVKKTRYKVVMTKPGLAYDDRYTLQVLVVKLPKFNADEDFMTFITNQMKKSQKQSGVEVLDQHAQFVEKEDKKCVQYNTKKKYSGRTRPVTLETVSFTCRHLERGDTGVYLAYSKKYSKGNDDKSLNINAADLFNHMELMMF
jgi:hypothetical protein